MPHRLRARRGRGKKKGGRKKIERASDHFHGPSSLSLGTAMKARERTGGKKKKKREKERR